jgi:hypothetical protein
MTNNWGKYYQLQTFSFQFTGLNCLISKSNYGENPQIYMYFFLCYKFTKFMAVNIDNISEFSSILTLPNSLKLEFSKCGNILSNIQHWHKPSSVKCLLYYLRKRADFLRESKHIKSSVRGWLAGWLVVLIIVKSWTTLKENYILTLGPVLKPV